MLFSIIYYQIILPQLTQKKYYCNKIYSKQDFKCLKILPKYTENVSLCIFNINFYPRFKSIKSRPLTDIHKWQISW